MFWDITYEHAWCNIHKSNMDLQNSRETSISEITFNQWLRYPRYKIYITPVTVK